MALDPGFADARLPTLSHALDGDWVNARMQQWLAQSDTPFTLQQCRLERFRYRPGERLVCLYELTLRDPTSGQCWRHWVTGLISADDSAEKRYRRGCRSDNAPCCNGLPSLRPQWLQESRMVLQHFPMDHRLTGLTALFAELPPALERLYKRHFGAREIRVCHPHPVRYRPLISAVLRQQGSHHDDAAQERREWAMYLKLRADHSGQLRFQRERQLSGLGDRLGLIPALPLGFIPELRLQVCPAVAGTSLDKLLLQNRSSVELWRRVGTRLATFHTAPVELTVRVGSASHLSRAQSAAALIGWALPEWKERLGALCRRQRELQQEPVWRACHGDLKPDHLLLDGERLRVIDLEDLCCSDPAMDIATLLVRLEWLWLTEPPAAGFGDSGGPLLDSYYAGVPADWQPRLGPLYSVMALDMARFAVQHQVANWRDLCRYFCQRSEAALTPGWHPGDAPAAVSDGNRPAASSFTE